MDWKAGNLALKQPVLGLWHAYKDQHVAMKALGAWPFSLLVLSTSKPLASRRVGRL